MSAFRRARAAIDAVHGELRVQPDALDDPDQRGIIADLPGHSGPHGIPSSIAPLLIRTRGARTSGASQRAVA